MSITENFLVNTKNFNAIIDELRTTSDLPEKITNKFLEKQGYSNPSDLLVLHLFKDLSMLNDDGTPTDLFDKFRHEDAEVSKQAMAQGIVEAYVDLFKSNSLVYRSGMAELKEEFKKLFGSSKSDLILKYMANTFLTLVEYAGSNNVEAISEKYLENVSGIEDVIREVAEKQKNGSQVSSIDTATEEEIDVVESDSRSGENVGKEEKGDVDIDQLISLTDSNPSLAKAEEETTSEESGEKSPAESPDVVEHVEPQRSSVSDSHSDEPGQVSGNRDKEEEMASSEEPASERPDSDLDMTVEDGSDEEVDQIDSEDEEQKMETEEKESDASETIFGLPVKEVEKKESSDPFEKKNELSQSDKDEESFSAEDDDDTDPFGFKAVMDFDNTDKGNIKFAQSKESGEELKSEETEVHEHIEEPDESEEHEEIRTEEKKEIAAKPEPVKASIPSSPDAAYVDKAFLKKAELLYKLGKYEEALPALKNVIDRYDDSRESEYNDHVARSVVHYAFVLEKLGRTREALTAYEEVYRRFENSEKIEYYNQASNALIKRIELMEQLDLNKKIAPLYSKVIDRLSESDNPRYIKYVDKAFLAQFEKLTELDDPQEVLKELTGFIERFSNSGKRNKYLKKAMYMKAELLEQLGKEEEALEAYDSILKTFGDES